MFDAEGYEVVAINDLTSPKMLAHLLKYDTAQGGYMGRIGEGKHTVSYKDAVLEEDGKTVKVPGSITVDGKEITIYAKPKAEELPWGELKVDVVLECMIPSVRRLVWAGKPQLGNAAWGASFPSERALPAGGFGSVHTPSP